MIIHYNCTKGSFLLHSFLLIRHPYPPSFHEMIFILVPQIFLVEASLERQGAPKMLIRTDYVRTYAHAYACALAQTAPLLSRRLVTRQWRLFEESVGQFIALYLAVFDSKVQRICWPKGTSLECVESIYVKTTETARVSD